LVTLDEREIGWVNTVRYGVCLYQPKRLDVQVTTPRNRRQFVNNYENNDK